MTLRGCLLVAAILLTACSELDQDLDVSEPAPPLTSDKPRIVAGELLVKLHQPLAGSRFEAAGYTLRPVKEIGPHLWLMRLEGGLELYDAATLEAATLQAVTALAGDARVAAVSENSYIPYARVPTDPLYRAQIWNYDTSIRLPLAWDITTGKSSVRIAILDSGRTEHPDLLWGPGKDFIDGDEVPTAAGTYHHGIHVAGIIGAQPNNMGGVGVCWGCTIMPWRTGDNLGNLRSAIASALYWAGGQIVPGQNGPRRADIVNLSSSAKESCNLSTAFAVRDALEFAVTQGVTVVVAGGNFGLTYDAQFPANCNSKTIAVAASEPGGIRASYSTRGVLIDITAPGGAVTVDPDIGVSYWGEDIWEEDIGVPCPRYTTTPPNLPDPPWVGTGGVVSTWTAATATPRLGDHCYRYLTGTSMATPHVSGVIGLMLSLNPELTPAQIEEKLRTTARPMSSTECPLGGCGGGMLDAYAAVLSARVFDVTPGALAFGDVLAGGMQDRTVTVTNHGTVPLTVLGLSSSNAAFTGVGPLPGPIAPGASASLAVRCQPPSAVSYTGTFSIATSGGAASVALSCQGVVPRLSVSPTSLAFGDVSPGGAADLNVAVSNTGTGLLTLSSPRVMGAAFSLVSVPAEPIAPGASASLTVRCLPPGAQNYAGTLELSSNGGSASVGLSCRGYAPVLSVVPASLEFGDVPVNTATGRVVTLTNTGTAPLTVSNFSLVGGPFYPASPMPGTIAPGGFTNFEVRCQPPWISTYTGTLSFFSDGGNASVALSCRGYAAEISAQQFLPFGDVRVGVASDRPLTVTNRGTAPLTLSEAQVNDPAFSIVGALPGPIAPGESANLTVRCLPSAAQSYSATLLLLSNGGSAVSGLACRGVVPVISVSPASLDYGTILVGVSRSKSFTVSNVGTAPLLVSGGSLTGLGFQLSTPPPFSVAPGASKSVTVMCLLTTAGYRTGTLVLQHDAGAPVSLRLSCNATSVKVQLVEPLSGMSLQATRSGRATIRNTGVGPLTVSNLSVSPTTPNVSIRSSPLPTTLAPGFIVSWYVDCGSGGSVPIKTAMFARFNGLYDVSLFDITCFPGVIVIPSPTPPPGETSAAVGPH